MPTRTVTDDRLVDLHAEHPHGLQIGPGSPPGLTPHSDRWLLDVAGGQAEPGAEGVAPCQLI